MGTRGTSMVLVLVERERRIRTRGRRVRVRVRHLGSNSKLRRNRPCFLLSVLSVPAFFLSLLIF